MSDLDLDCIVCNDDLAKVRNIGGGAHVKCPECGDFGIKASAVRFLMENENKKKELAAILFERRIHGNGSITISKEISDSNDDFLKEYPSVLLDDLLKQFPRTVSEQMDRSIMNIAVLSDFPGKDVAVHFEDCALLYTKSPNAEETQFILSQLKQDGLIEYGKPTLYFQEVKLTAKGWNRVAELQRNKESDSKQAFVAMWFEDKMNSVYQNAIKKAIEDAGFNPMRIDELEHNDKIDDAIIAQIQRSKFVIADFTGHRGGVYFEAGYAMGLGLPVIWSCRKDALDKLHFDTRQYSHLVWETEQELYKLLLNRIKATIK
ncbi:hypothetical protein [Bacillus cereus]|uniref:hypothetical protein n=1 Tax=Bacillus cereus TaxID=1396 RepID=UPI000776D589|nr:hypothetical protein [Bacillus cereus]UUE91497.1 nucleoside 2-deoxyribosyltransferase [Bacillus cereus]